MRELILKVITLKKLILIISAMISVVSLGGPGKDKVWNFTYARSLGNIRDGEIDIYSTGVFFVEDLKIVPAKSGYNQTVDLTVSAYGKEKLNLKIALSKSSRAFSEIKNALSRGDKIIVVELKKEKRAGRTSYKIEGVLTMREIKSSKLYKDKDPNFEKMYGTHLLIEDIKEERKLAEEKAKPVFNDVELKIDSIGGIDFGSSGALDAQVDRKLGKPFLGFTKAKVRYTDMTGKAFLIVPFKDAVTDIPDDKIFAEATSVKNWFVKKYGIKFSEIKAGGYAIAYEGDCKNVYIIISGSKSNVEEVSEDFKNKGVYVGIRRKDIFEENEKAKKHSSSTGDVKPAEYGSEVL